MKHRKKGRSASSRTAPLPLPPPVASLSPWNNALIAAVLVLAGLLAYSNSFHCAFIYDDLHSIVENPSLKPPLSLSKVLNPPGGMTTSYRPLLNLSLALCNLSGDFDPLPFHIFNLAVHLLACLTLFGLLRRTLNLPALVKTYGKAATPLAFICALLWLLHPLQTESVTYIIQRAESMMGLFYLLVIYCSLRAMNTSRPGRWYFAAVVACVMGMSCKEVTASAPVIVALYDRIFLFRSFREAWARRRVLYVSLPLAWLLILRGIIYAPDGFGTLGWNIEELRPLEYAATQCKVVLGYIRLVFWPNPLNFDYGLPDSGMPIVRTFSQWFFGYGMIVPLLVILTLVALRRWPFVGFLGVWFFAVLGPTSSFIPIVTEVVAEHRMYIPLAPIIVLTVLAAYRAGIVFQARFAPGDLRRRGLAWSGLGLSAVLAFSLGCRTFQRNRDYESSRIMWQKTLATNPGNARAHMILASELAESGDLKNAFPHFEEAVRLRPNYPEANIGLGIALERIGRPDEALPHYQKGLTIWPDYIPGNIALGSYYYKQGRFDEARIYFRKAVDLNPNNEQMRNSLGAVLLQSGRLQEAQVQLEEAIRLNPGYLEAHNNLGAVLLHQERWEEALIHFQTAVKLDPDSSQAHHTLGRVLEHTGKISEAVLQYREAARLDPHLEPIQADLRRAEMKLAEGKR